MAEIKDIFGIGDTPVQKSAVQDEETPDALSFFGVPVKEKEEQK